MVRGDYATLLESSERIRSLVYFENNKRVQVKDALYDHGWREAEKRCWKSWVRCEGDWPRDIDYQGAR
jgi:hypothetical protein